MQLGYPCPEKMLKNALLAEFLNFLEFLIFFTFLGAKKVFLIFKFNLNLIHPCFRKKFLTPVQKEEFFWALENFPMKTMHWKKNCQDPGIRIGNTENF